MPRGAELIVKILTDATQATKGIDTAAGGFSQLESSMGALAGPATAVTGAVALIGAASVNAASETQQSMGAIDAVFGDSAGQIKDWASQAADAVGLSEAAYGQFASTIGAQLKNLGVPMDQVAGGTDDLIKLGADLAATYGGSTEKAVQALSSALRGEADPAEAYGLALNQTAVNAELAAQGLSGLEGEQLTAAKAAIVMQLATEQAGGAVGQFGREADTVSGQQQRATAAWADASAALGEALLPAMTAATAALGDMAKWVQDNARFILPLIIGIGALAAAILAINGAIAVYNAVQAAMKIATAISTAAQWAWNAAMSANPIGIIILAIAALVAGFIYLWNTNEDFRNFFISLWEGIASFFTGLWEGIKAVVASVVEWFMSAWTGVSAFFTGLWNGIISVVSSVVNWFRGIWDGIAKFFSQVWQVAVLLVQAYIQAWVNMFRAIFNTIKSIVDGVVSFFTDAWRGAVLVVSNIIKTLQSIFTSVFNAIMVPINAVVNAFNAVVSAVKSVIDWIGKIKIPDLGGLFGIGKSAPQLATAPGGQLFAASGLRVPAPAAATGGGGGTTIVVQGGLDSADTIARRIQQLLDARERRAGGVTLKRRTT